MIRALAESGVTILLTTQYMEEADRLADNIVVIDQGRVIAEGTADRLKAKIGGERIEIILESGTDIGRAHGVLASIACGDIQIDREMLRITAAVDGGADSLREALHELHTSKVSVVDVGLRRPTLDDVFLTLTGHHAEGGSQATDETAVTLEEVTR